MMAIQNSLLTSIGMLDTSCRYWQCLEIEIFNQASVSATVFLFGYSCSTIVGSDLERGRGDYLF